MIGIKNQRACLRLPLTSLISPGFANREGSGYRTCRLPAAAEGGQRGMFEVSFRFKRTKQVAETEPGET